MWVQPDRLTTGQTEYLKEDSVLEFTDYNIDRPRYLAHQERITSFGM
jgi:hypothetical protein